MEQFQESLRSCNNQHIYVLIIGSPIIPELDIPSHAHVIRVDHIDQDLLDRPGASLFVIGTDSRYVHDIINIYCPNSYLLLDTQ